MSTPELTAADREKARAFLAPLWEYLTPTIGVMAIQIAAEDALVRLLARTRDAAEHERDTAEKQCAEAERELNKAWIDLAAVRAETVEQQWQPIETAPKDGTHFLAFWKAPLADEPTVIIARWNTILPWVGFYGVNVQRLDGRGTLASLESGFVENMTLHATHWMPLPTPPALANPGDTNV